MWLRAFLFFGLQGWSKVREAGAMASRMASNNPGSCSAHPWQPHDLPPQHKPPLSHTQVGAIAIEIWTMDEALFFDNVIISNSPEEAEAFRKATHAPKKVVEDKVGVSCAGRWG